MRRRYLLLRMHLDPVRAEVLAEAHLEPCQARRMNDRIADLSARWFQAATKEETTMMPIHPIEDQEIETMAEEYRRLLPSLVTVPLRFTNDDGWIPEKSGLWYLAERAGHQVENDRYRWVMVAGRDGGWVAIVFAPELAGLQPQPTFEQYCQWRCQRAESALSEALTACREAAAHFEQSPARPAPRR